MIGSTYSYLFDWEDFLLPRMAAALLDCPQCVRRHYRSARMCPGVLARLRRHLCHIHCAFDHHCSFSARFAERRRMRSTAVYLWERRDRNRGGWRFAVGRSRSRKRNSSLLSDRGDTEGGERDGQVLCQSCRGPGGAGRGGRVARLGSQSRKTHVSSCVAVG